MNRNVRLLWSAVYDILLGLLIWTGHAPWWIGAGLVMLGVLFTGMALALLAIGKSLGGLR